MLSLFFGAHVVVTAILIPALGVRDPLYHIIPWIFVAAFLVTLIPGLRPRLRQGALAWRVTPVLLYAAVITLASSVNPRGTTGVPSFAFHHMEYAGLAFLALYASHHGFARPPRFSRGLLVVLACAAFGVMDEVHQSFVPNRTPAATDVALDVIGALAGTALYLGLAWVSRRGRDPNGSPPSGTATTSS